MRTCVGLGMNYDPAGICGRREPACRERPDWLNACEPSTQFTLTPDAGNTAVVLGHLFTGGKGFWGEAACITHHYAHL